MPRKPDAIPLFLSFCIEQYKHAHALTGREAMEVLARTGTLDYLEQHYEVLHTQGPEWILAEVEEYLDNPSRLC